MRLKEFVKFRLLKYRQPGNRSLPDMREAVARGGETRHRESHPSPEIELNVVAESHGANIDEGRPDLGIMLSTPSASRISMSSDREPDNDMDNYPIPDHIQEALPAVGRGGSDWGSVVSATAKLFLRLVRDSADCFPPLRSTAGGLYAILESIEKTDINKQAIESLAPRIRSLAGSLRRPGFEDDVDEKKRREELGRKLEEVRQALGSITAGGKMVQFLKHDENARELNALVDVIRGAIMDYQTSLQQDIYDKSRRLIEATDLALLNAMRRTPDAGYHCGDRQGCLMGTREDVLWKIEHWLRDRQGRRVFWLSGLPGTGKTTIAQTFAETSFAGGKLGASFFCSRDFEDRSDLRAILPTLAFQLAYRYPRFRKELLRVLRTSPDVGRESLCSQMEKVIVGPLKASHISTLIIIDALDECKDEEPASAMLSILSRYVDQIPAVKFFITGRPEARIRSGFRLPTLLPLTGVLELHDVERSLVDSDIKLFFQTQFAGLVKSRSDCDPTEDWPSLPDIEILCKKAGGLFIYASTVVKFVAYRHHQPKHRLTLITSPPQDSSYEGKLGIDLLYTQVLEQAFHDVDRDDHELYSHFKSVVGAVLLVFRPLSVGALSDLLGNCGTPPRVPNILHALHSLLLVPDNREGPVRIFHKSFPDFLTDPERCKDPKFFINPAISHRDILLSCLDVMKRKLKKNICDLDDHVVLSGVSDLPDRGGVYIGDALAYACRFWANHLIETPSDGSGAQDVLKAIEDFFENRLLFWIEVLGLIENLNAGIYALNNVQRWYGMAGASCEWTDDSQRLILDNFDAIHDSPSQLYHFALPFCPSSSWLRGQYKAEFSQKVNVVVGLPAKWGACSRTVNFNQTPLALACHKGTIAVGLQLGDIVILDAITGTSTSTLPGHTDLVRSLAFSRDGALLASGSSDKTIRLWDIQTGGVVETFHGHSSGVLSVSISQDSVMIASGSEDKTIRLWDIQKRNCHCIIDHHQDIVTCVDFSPTDPRRLMSASFDGTVRQWGVDGCQLGPPHSGYLAAYSPPDGTRFFSYTGSEEAATFRHSDSGEVIAELRVSDGDFNCYCFSPDGKFVANAAGRTVHVWDVAGSHPYLVGTFVGHAGEVASLTWSSSLISASDDNTVKFWQVLASVTGPVVTDTEPTPFTPKSTRIESLSLHATDGIAISSDSAGVVRKWDISTGHCRASFQTPAKGNERRDVQLINGRPVVVWYAVDNDRVGKIRIAGAAKIRLPGGGKIHIWDAERGELLRMVDAPERESKDLRISGDGSKVFCLGGGSIRAWSIETGVATGEVELKGQPLPGSLTVDGSRIWVRFNDLSVQGWDFGIPESSPIPLSNEPPSRYRLDFTDGTREWNTGPSRIKDAATGKEVFRLSGRYAKPDRALWGGRYLVAGYHSGEVIVMDLDNLYPQ